ncbi:division/cell wall cluster transcriptional repressor MraZ [Brevundimonas basaltis]
MGLGVFLSTYEKQLDGKRRLLIPQEFRTADNGAEHGVFCFFSIENDCLEAGGDKLMAEYVSMIEELPFGDDVRTALEETFYAGQRPLAYDGGGRITLPEHLCQDAGLGEDVVIVGLGSRFQIWDRARWNARRDERRALARQAVRERGEAGRKALLAGRRPGGEGA